MKLNETKDKRIIKFFETLEEKLNKFTTINIIILKQYI